MRDVDFLGVVYSQQLVMVLSYLDGFFADSIRTVCQAKPEVIKTSKQVTWKEILEIGSWDGIKEFLLDEYVFSSGWKSFRDGLKNFKEKLGLTLVIPDATIERIDSAEKLRNVVVHNNGKVSAEYFRRTDRKDVKIGESISIESGLVEALSLDILAVAGELYLGISEKYFKMDRRLITGIWRTTQAK